jgi:hypothetical protein
MKRCPFPEPYFTHPLINTKFHLSFKVPSKEAPFPCSPSGVPMEKDAPSPQPIVYSFIYISESPVKKLSHVTGRKMWSPSMNRQVDRRPTHDGVLPHSPQRSFTTLLSLPQCHAALSTIPSTFRKF